MHRSKNKGIGPLRAFTLIEVLVVMVLTTLLMSLSVGAYFGVVRILKMYQTHQSASTELLRLTTIFSNDFENAVVVSGQADDLTLELKNKTQVHYLLTPAGVVRTTGDVQESFPVKVSTPEATYLQQSDGWIQSLRMELYDTLGKTELLLVKEYSSEILFELESRNGH